MPTLKTYAPTIVPKMVHVSKGVATTQGAEFGPVADIGVGLLRVAHFKYDFAKDGGAISTITPVATVYLPVNAIIYGGLLDVTTAPTGTAGATVSVGTSAGSSATALFAATVIASLGLGLYDLVPVHTAASAVKLTAAGNVTVSIAVHALTAGVIEGWIEYYVASA